MDRKRLCLTVPIGTSLKIGDDVLHVSHVIGRPTGNKSQCDNSAAMELTSGAKIELYAGEEAYFRNYSIQASEITTTRVRMAIHACESIKIQRLGSNVDYE